MRFGQNPAKFVETVHQPENITVAVVVYIPFLSGYYTQSLEVLKTCLGSIWQNSDLPYDLMVFDNASCAEVRQFLSQAHQQGQIQYLVLSEQNVGKAGAWNFIFGAAPGEIIVYADSDVYFYPGWLSAQVEALKALPNVGMVTGMPLRTPAQFSTATLEWAEAHPEVPRQAGQILSWDDYWRHALSLGVPEEQARQAYESSQDTCLEAGGKRYFVGAGHFQFTAPKAALQSVLPVPSNRPMGQVRLLDVAMNDKGYLRLSTPEWWVRHMGNALAGENAGLAVVAQVSPGRPRASLKRIFQWGPVRRVLLGLYGRIFNLYFRK